MNRNLYNSAISTNAQTPFLLFDQSALRETCREFSTSFPNCPIYYSVKANSTSEILNIVKSEGLNFDTASWNEILTLKKLGVKADRICFSAPTKLPLDIEKSFRYGIRNYAFDSKIEVEKLAKLAPSSNLLARVAVDNEGSEWPLVRKFGLTNEEAFSCILHAKKLGLNPIGFTFHVGSQNLKPSTWARALERVFSVWLELKLKGHSLPVVNLGGGFPVEYTRKVPSIPEISKQIFSHTKKLFGNHVELWLEPGRKVVAENAILVTTVINRARRDGDEWIYLDTGVYNGLQETIEGFRYTVKTRRRGKKKRNFVLCGPTCDSTDKIMTDVKLPDSISLGDRLYFLTAGAYTTSYEKYNGYDYPTTILTK